jgi:hypothetical protein
MLIHPTIERLRALGLAAMADALIELQNAPDAAELTREDWLGLLVDREATSRENKRLARRLREARLRQPAVVEDSTFAPIAASIALCSANSPPASGSASIITWSWLAQPASASRGWLVLSVIRPAAKASRCFTNAPPGCSAIWPRRAARAACPAC